SMISTVIVDPVHHRDAAGDKCGFLALDAALDLVAGTEPTNRKLPRLGGREVQRDLACGRVRHGEGAIFRGLAKPG
ncbi:MAG: hypothetical protein NTX07_04655, partial [Solirubrobacterales bacterium]|nr:hypothetical protein [Solirubrobacterales bacterium]